MGNFTSQPVQEPIEDGLVKVSTEEDEFDETCVTELHPDGTYTNSDGDHYDSDGGTYTNSDGDHCDSDGGVFITFTFDEGYLRSQLASTGSFDNPFFED